jgi:HTH-type transcriptional regulator, sugar sensing transcriptional regulator
MYEETFTQAGLSLDQAKMYEILLKGGVMPASKVALKAGLKRGLGYKVIEQLVFLGLVEKIDKKVALFAPNHPSKLKEMLQKKAEDIKNTDAVLSGLLGPMISDYNLTVGKPNVRFFEGEEGVRKVLEDTLYSQEEILSYADIAVIQKYIPDINTWYVTEREKKGIKKRAILIDTPEARAILASYHRTITDSRVIKLETPLFESIMQIYDGKVSYITLSDNQKIGIIIEDVSVYEMHKALFNVTWSKAQEL